MSDLTRCQALEARPDRASAAAPRLAARVLVPAALVLSLSACDKGGATSTAAPPAGATSTGAAIAAATATAQLGAPAPDFTLKDLDGKPHRLADHKGKIVVVEWFNPGCPFVKQNHGKGNLKDMAKRWTERGVVWLAVNSGAPGKQGHGVDVNREAQKTWGMEHPILLDESGDVGRSYGAKTTPHIFVVDAKGTLVYRGAIDNAPDGEPAEGDKILNYAEDALTEVQAGKPVTKPETTPYGCSVKYASK